MSITLKGATSSSRSSQPKLKWDLAWKIYSYKLCKVDKLSAKAALEQTADHFGFRDKLPESYVEHAYSHMYRFQKELQKKIEKNDAASIQAMRDAGLIQEGPAEPVADEVSEDEFTEAELTGEES